MAILAIYWASMDMTICLRTLSVVCAVAAVSALGIGGLCAQGWGWDDGREQAPGGYDRGGEPQQGSGQRPVYGQEPGYGTQPGRAPGQEPSQAGYGQPRGAAYTSSRCRELEYQLTGGNSPGASDQLPRIEAEMRQADGQYQRALAEAERANCYEDMFLFGRSLRRTPRCLELDRQVQQTKSILTQLKTQREALLRTNSPRTRRDELIADLARNRCGDQYVREYESQHSRSGSIFSFFSDEEPEDTSRRNPSSPWGSSAYRTLCVRECDGFYFPVSTATSEGQFAEDEAKCHSQCAAPAQLFYHRTDQDVDQMMSVRGVPYSQMPNAFRYRKVYIRGCSCNASEFSREEIAKSEEALKYSKRADASAGPAGNRRRLAPMQTSRAVSTGLCRMRPHVRQRHLRQMGQSPLQMRRSRLPPRRRPQTHRPQQTRRRPPHPRGSEAEEGAAY